MSNWKTYKLGEFAELRKEQIVPNGKEQPYIGLEHIEQQSLRLNGVGSSNNVISNKFKFYSSDVLYGKLRPYFRKVYKPKFDGVCSTDIYVIKNKKLVDKDYLFYLVATEEFTNIANSGSSGTRMPRADWKQLEKSEWQLPDLPTQRQIAQILSSLDDKIELNLQMNQTLEAMAQAIFKEWFVPSTSSGQRNFNFPGFDGELVDGLPKGWRMGVLSDVIEFTNGFAFKSTDLIDYPEEDCYHVFKMGNINKGGGFNYEGTKSYFKKADADKLGKYILKKGDLLMCMTDMKDNVALLGHTALMNQDDKFLVNQRVGLLRPNNNLSIDYPYLYNLTNYPEFIKEIRSRANRGVQVNLSTSEIKNTKIVIPEQSVNVQFDEVTKPIFEKIFANIENIQELTQTRDTLLPKLMSGVLEVKSEEWKVESGK